VVGKLKNIDMTQEEIKYNKLCADVMGWKNLNDDSYPEYLTPMGDFYSLKNLMFDSDWNWIMMVIEKIEGLGFATKIQHDYCISNYGCDSCEIDTRENALFIPDEYKEGIEPIVFELTKTKKQATIQAIYKFLIWYNKKDETN
jgi:hypothetical protein